MFISNNCASFYLLAKEKFNKASKYYDDDCKLLDCQFTLKFGTKSSSDLKNSVVILILPAFIWKYPFLGNLFHKGYKEEFDLIGAI